MQQQELRQRKTAMIAIIVLALMAVATFVILDNALSIGPLVDLTIAQFIWTIVGFDVVFLTCSATAFAISVWLIAHRPRRSH